ncbi:kinesin-like protein KIN-14F [Olea europaea var. sylvestris]|uniref:kinesin-like protein KIN-14F n=1 Tax=Olea europaea var. sylvestris TaxID=158386 RepID=UPI000C1D80B3|nr:kinesin-like protein KIN-14F [Olea europaea var. sylvestris]
MIFWTFQKSSASPSKPLALPTPVPSSLVEATSSKPVDDGIMLKGISSVPDSSSQLMNEPPSSQGVYPPITEAEDTPMSPPVVATSSRSDKGKSSQMDESLVASLAEGAPSSTIVDEFNQLVVYLLTLFFLLTEVQEEAYKYMLNALLSLIELKTLIILSIEVLVIKSLHVNLYFEKMRNEGLLLFCVSTFMILCALIFLHENCTSIPDIVDLFSQYITFQDLKTLFKETKQEVQWVQLGWGKELQRLEHHFKSLEVAASSYHKILEENRLLYNQVQDLKGTIRVFCRVRPFLPGQFRDQSTVDYIGENGNIMIVSPQKQGKDARKVFTFDKVFGANVTQEQIYADTQPLIRSVLDGYNVCMFAYGQTGSGKTYTMSGPDLTTEETWGVNYRALRDLFRISKARMDVIKYEVGVQMIEIYNEQVRDLLVVHGSNRRLDIRNNSQLNGLNVPDASLVPVTCTKDVLDLMKIGQRNRAVGATALNERSSRSHSILTIHVRGKELVSGSMLKGCLHLVDLAGSERVDKSEAVGERLKEAQHINRSLSALGDVIYALAQKSSHVPYRNSKLTQVLQDSLGGHAKTLMFVHINPEVNAIGETISTLKFAERVATIDLGAAQSNKEASELREFKDEISNLKLALERKEAELEQLKSRTNIQGMLSPLRVSKNGNCVNSKPETAQQHGSEVRSCSSGKQRRPRVPSKFTDKDVVPKMPFLAEERSMSSIKPRSPSPPIRRSTSTDRGSLVRSRNRHDALDNPPVMKQVFPSSISANKSVTNIPAITPSAANTRLYPGSQEPIKQDNVSDLFNSLQRATTRKVHLEKEDEQFKQALNVRQGGIRKSKPESKVRSKHQLPAKNQKSDIAETLSDMDNGKMLEAKKTDFSNPENEPVQLPVCGTTRTHKLHRSFSRSSQHLEPREPAQLVEPSLAGYHENKFPNSVLQNVKEAGNSSVPEFRRSRSTPRGKFMV